MRHRCLVMFCGRNFEQSCSIFRDPIGYDYDRYTISNTSVLHYIILFSLYIFYYEDLKPTNCCDRISLFDVSKASFSRYDADWNDLTSSSLERVEEQEDDVDLLQNLELCHHVSPKL